MLSAAAAIPGFTFRMGLVIGGVTGYILGARAGQERYEQIASLGRRLRGSKPAQQLGVEARDLVGRATETIEQKATDGVAKVTGRARQATGTGDGSSEGNGHPA